MISVRMWGVWTEGENILTVKPQALLPDRQGAQGFIMQRFWKGVRKLKAEEVEVGWGMPVEITRVPRKSPESREPEGGQIQKMIKKALPRKCKARTIT